jgi:hypothetical protein
MIGIPFVECGQFPANFDDRLMTGLSLPFMFSWHCPKSTRSQCREAEGWATLGVTPVFCHQGAFPCLQLHWRPPWSLRLNN